MNNFSIAISTVKYLVACLLLAVSIVGSTGEQSDEAIDHLTKNAEQVLTPELAGRQFLRNAGSFRDENAKTSNILAARTITADFADGRFQVRHTFHADGQTFTWEVLTGQQMGQTGTVPYQAYDLRPGIAFVMAQPADNESIALIIDDNRGVATGFLGRHLPGHDSRQITLTPLNGPILEAKARVTAAPFESAGDLVGTRFRVIYPDEVAVYEHIYLNDHYVTWLGHKGTSAGVADTERYEAIKIAPHLYLIAWSEKAAPIQISFLFDFDRKQELAAVFGYDEKAERNVYQTTSAKIAEIMHTRIAGLK